MGQIRFLLVPIVIIAFNLLFMVTMRTVLIGITYSGIGNSIEEAKLYTAFTALVIAAVILIGAAYLSRRGPNQPANVDEVENR